MTMTAPPEDDFLDGCDLDFSIDPDSEEVSELRALFPRGDEDKHRAVEWQRTLAAAPQLQSDLLRIARTVAPYSGSGRDIGIANRLREAGLKVVEIDGWQTRGSATFHPVGSVDHHTAGGASGNAPSLGICINGRADLSGPLCNVLIGRDNTCCVIAAGRANHAGAGGWQGLSGNSNMYGVERENRGTSAEPWRADQTETAARCHAALLGGRSGAKFCCEHKEWAPTRKSDAHTISGADMRANIQKFITNPVPSTQEDDMSRAILYPGGRGVCITDGVFKFGIGSPKELQDFANCGIIPKNPDGSPQVGIIDKDVFDRIPDANVLFNKAGASKPAAPTAEMAEYAKAVVEELAAAIAAGLHRP